MYCREEKVENRTRYGFKRKNTYDYIKSSNTPLVYFRVTPTGIGKTTCLRAKLETIIGSVFDSPSSTEINPCFDYLIRRLVYYEALSSNKKTEYRMIIGNEMSSDITNPIHEAIIKRRVEQIILELQKAQNNDYKCKDLKRVSKLEMFDKKMQKFSNQLRLQLRKYYEKRASDKDDFRSTPYYIEEVICNINKIELLRISQQVIKYSTFDRNNKGYFDTSTIIEKKLKTIDLKLNRPSSEKDCIIENVQDRVMKELEAANLQAENYILIRDIFHQLKVYEDRNSSQNNKVHYQWLHPNSVIFDLISLRPKLSYQPLLLDLLGVKEKPMSVENRIVFYPTPRSFDYFRSLTQLDPRTKLILNDPFYGNEDLYDSDRHRLTPEQLREIEEQKNELVQIKQNMMVWRFLLLAHYIRHRKQFGLKEKLPSNQAKQENFKAKLIAAKQELEKDMRHLDIFLGSSEFIGSKGFGWNLRDVGEYLCIQKEDSVVESHKYLMIRKYFQIRNNIIKELIRLLVNDSLFGRIFNIKKYTLIYLAIAAEIFEEARRLAEVEKAKPKERKNVRLYLERNLKRLKADKNHFSHLQSMYDKVLQYCSRDAEKDNQAKFAMKEEVGKIIMGYLRDIDGVIKQLQQDSESLNRLEAEEAFSPEGNHIYQEYLEKVIQSVHANSPKVKGLLNEFLFTELKLRYREGPHKITDEALKNAYKMYTDRLELLVLVFLNMHESNFLTYDTLVFPLFKIDESEKKFDIPKTLDVRQQENNLKSIRELIEASKLQPARMSYLSTQAIKNEFIIYQRSKAPP